MNFRIKQITRLLLFYLGLLIAWQVLAELKLWAFYLFPAPLDVLRSLQQRFADRTLLIGVGVTLRRIALGYGLAVIFGVVLGWLLAARQWLQDTVGSLVVGLQSLPSICWLPLAILWFGLNEKAILFVTVAGSLLAVSINTTAGLHHVPKIYRMAGRNLGAHGVRLFVHVLLPASLPHLVSGLKQGWAFAWRSLISGEMIFVTVGLGQLLMMGRDLNDISQVVSVMIVIIAIGYFVDQGIFRLAESRIRRRWGLLGAL